MRGLRPLNPPRTTMRRLFAVTLTLALTALAVYLVAVNAQWRERARVADSNTDAALAQVDSLESLLQSATDAAEQFRSQADSASHRVQAVTGTLASVRAKLDSVERVEDSVTVLVAVVATQDTVIEEQVQEIVSLRAESSQLRAGARLLVGQRDIALGQVDSLRVLVNRAPVVQLAAPKPNTGWMVAAALVAGILVGVF